MVVHVGHHYMQTLVAVKLDVETFECRLSSMLFRGSVNNSKAERNSQPRCEAFLTDREEVQFHPVLQLIE